MLSLSSSRSMRPFSASRASIDSSASEWRYVWSSSVMNRPATEAHASKIVTGLVSSMNAKFRRSCEYCVSSCLSRCGRLLGRASRRKASCRMRWPRLRRSSSCCTAGDFLFSKSSTSITPREPSRTRICPVSSTRRAESTLQASPCPWITRSAEQICTTMDQSMASRSGGPRWCMKCCASVCAPGQYSWRKKSAPVCRNASRSTTIFGCGTRAHMSLTWLAISGVVRSLSTRRNA
mmetsp:Transcript_24425/g.78474  ORF Transcript_24425/g.78474 Transcript_24425/m.78474 type:complete len:235 (-) Transcript_24425:411-1115(-)